MWRIAQEALTNVERHAGATRVRVLWRCNGESAALEVTDNGTGFPDRHAPAASTPTASSGMRERASSIGATLDITSEPGKGTRVRCTLLRTPIADERPAAAAARDRRATQPSAMADRRARPVRWPAPTTGPSPSGATAQIRGGTG